MAMMGCAEAVMGRAERKTKNRFGSEVVSACRGGVSRWR
jgi:hypothetical protein